jgi:predicted phage terminase large subunit-like protein
MPQPLHLLHATLRQDFGSFIIKCITTTNPGIEYLHNWHVDIIADRLNMACRGEIPRLLINMPPRYLKSVCVNVAWPAWILGHTPTARILSASYSQILSTKHSLDCRLILNSSWYRQLFPDTQIAGDQNEKNKFMTTKRGFRFATSVGGTATGEGGDFLIVDDPHNPLQAASETKRMQAIEWFDQTFSSRLDNKKKGVIVVVMQRLHPYDLSGHILEKLGNHWEHLHIPAISESPCTYYYFSSKQTPLTIIHHRNAGDILHPAREGTLELTRTKEELGSHAFAAQYQQSPILQEGGMVEARWFKRHRLLDIDPVTSEKTEQIVQSWDAAVKAGRHNDYSVCTTWLSRNDGFYLLDVWYKRVEYPELKHAVINLADKWEPHAILIEDKASGQSLLQDIRRETTKPLIPIVPKQDKISRFSAVTALFEAGKVFLPNKASWLIDYETQLLHFPNVAHDDIVDSTSQALSWMHYKRKSAPRVRSL